MRRKTWIVLLSLALAAVSLLLWVRISQVDFAIDDQVRKAENDRHDLVISHDFDHLKEKLIEVHRDYWIAVAREEREARLETICMGALVIVLGLAVAREVRRSA